MNIKHPLPKSALAGCGLLLLCAGCTTPDLKPFADSTANMRQAVVQSQNIIRSEMTLIAEKSLVADPSTLNLAKTNIPDSFKPRVAFMEAVVNYTDSLAAVADAGKNGQANAQALGDSVQQLANVVGPYGQAVGAGATIFAQGYGEIAQARAFQALRKATEKAGPIIQRGAELMSKDMGNIVTVLQSGELDLTTSLQEPYQNDIIIRNRLVKFRKQKSEEITAAIGQTNWVPLLAKHNQEMAELDAVLDRMDKWYLPLQKEEADVRERFEAEAGMVRNTEKAFKQWAKVHSDLMQSLRDNRQPNIRELVITVLEIKSEIEQLKKH